MALPTLGGAQLWADRRWREGWRIQRRVSSAEHRLLDPIDRLHARGSFAQCEAELGRLRLRPSSEEVVVLLHGLGRTRRSLRAMAGDLRDDGRTVVSLDYPSTRASLVEHVSQVLDVLANLEGARRVSFVTHSLGGIVARGVLADERWPEGLEPYRIAMFAPPNRGAKLARRLDAAMPLLFAGVMGPAGREIVSAPDYPVPTIPLLVVAGSTRGGRGINPWLDGDDDGVVRVEETRLDGMSQHLVVDSLHTTLMNHPRARAAVKQFLAE